MQAMLHRQRAGLVARRTHAVLGRHARPPCPGLGLGRRQQCHDATMRLLRSFDAPAGGWHIRGMPATAVARRCRSGPGGQLLDVAMFEGARMLKLSPAGRKCWPSLPCRPSAPPCRVWRRRLADPLPHHGQPGDRSEQSWNAMPLSVACSPCAWTCRACPSTSSATDHFSKKFQKIPTGSCTSPGYHAGHGRQRLPNSLTAFGRSGCGHSRLRIRGGGSKDFYGESLQGERAGHPRPVKASVSYEPSELVVTVRAGTPLAELEAVLAAQGQYLPFEPPHFATSAGDVATVGGMVAAGLGARPALRWAMCATMCWACRCSTAGRAAHLWRPGDEERGGLRRVALDGRGHGHAGPDRRGLLKVLPVAVAEATLRFHLDEAEAIKQLNAWAGKPLPLNASCWVNDDKW
jgi:hypothetical protein